MADRLTVDLMAKSVYLAARNPGFRLQLAATHPDLGKLLK